MRTRRDKWAAGHHEHFAATYALAMEALIRSQDFLTSTPFDQSRPAVALALFYRRALTNFEAMTVLLTHGFASEARAMHRSMIEAVIRLSALVEDPTCYNELLDQRYLEHRDRGRDLLSARKISELADDQEPTEQQLNEFIEKANMRLEQRAKELGRNPKSINSFEWSKKGKILPLFWGRYADLSTSVHHSLDDLSRHVKRKSGTDEVEGIDIGPENIDPSSIILDGIQCLAIVVAKFAKARDRVVPAALNKTFRSALQRLENEYGGARSRVIE